MDGETTKTVLEFFVEVVGTVWTQITNCMGTITGNAILLLSFGVAFAGVIIGLSKRFMRFGRRR